MKTKSIIREIILDAETCCSCGVVFGMDRDMIARRRRDGEWFYCPNGHKQHYSETEADRLRKQLAHERDNRGYAESALSATRDQLDATRRSNTALKGVVTRTKRRVAHGVCPIPGCKRTFAALADHMRTVHPDHQHTDPES